MDRLRRRRHGQARSDESSPLRAETPIACVEAISLSLFKSSKSGKIPGDASIVVRLTCNKSIIEVKGSAAEGRLNWTPASEFPLGDITVEVILKRTERWIPDRKLERIIIKAALVTPGEGGLYEYTFPPFGSLEKASVELSISFSGLASVTTQADTPAVDNTTLVEGESPAEQAASHAEALRSPAGFEAASKVIDTATQLVGPIQSVLDHAESLTGTLQCLSQAMSYMDKIVEVIKTFAEIHPISKVGVKALTTIYDLVKAQGDRDENIKVLAASIRDMLATLSEIQELEKKIKLLQSAIYLAMTRIDECGEFIKLYVQHGFWGRLIRQSLTSHTADTIQGFQTGFTQLKEKFNTAVAVQTLKATVEVTDVLKINLRSIETTISDKVDEERLNNLPRSKGGTYDCDQQCLPGTRQDILNLIYDWIDSKQHNTFWLRGPAGSGKSTIASTVAAQLHDNNGGLGCLGLGSLGATFFCKRDDKTLNQPTLVLPTIAFRLASAYPPLRTGIVSALKVNPDVGESSIANQFQELIVQPLKELPHDLDVPPVVIIIDAMDECGDVKTRQALLKCIRKVGDLPAWFKLLVTSRPTDDIKPHFSQLSYGYKIDTANKQSTLDIKAYTVYRVHQLRHDRELQSDWPGESKVDQLVIRAEGLFIWVTVAFDFISDLEQSSPTEALKSILESSGVQHLDALDALYRTVVVRDLVKARDFELIHSILGCIVVAKIPLSLQSICSLLDIPYEKARWATGRIASVLRTDSASNIRAIHQSFLDFLTDSERSDKFFIDVDHYNSMLARRCLETMNGKLHTNMCKLTDMSKLNDEIPDIASRLDKCVAEDVLYSCLHWAEHLVQVSSQDPQIAPHLRKFCNEHALHWLEVLGLTGQGRNAAGVMRKIEKWLPPDDPLKALVRDIVRFSVTHGYVISHSAPHIYVNATIFTPPDSHLCDPAKPQFATGFTLLNGPENFWDPKLLRVDAKAPIHSVTFSPDGTKIVSGCGDRTIRVWDAESGSRILGPLPGHTNSVTSVAFSPDGTKLVSGSRDQTVCVWDAESGFMILGPLLGHTDCVNSIAFSPDGTKIVSGSRDKTVCVWNAESGSMIIGPLLGHTDAVNSVTFSPDGTKIVSGSDDRTVRVWDAESGSIILTPLLGHTNNVNAVAFSPDGTKIVSGSGDRTVRVWDVESGFTILGPLLSHTGYVNSVAFSPDGTKIVSGSRDKTVRVWNAESGSIILGPLLGHTDWVNSVAFSPDGTQIMSGSDDRTLRVWDAESGSTVLGPLLGHTDDVNSIAFSPDGTKIVSCSRDKTVRVWDAESGSVILGPLHGHTDWVNSVAFSPDGTKIVSGSRDRTVRVWDAKSGSLILGPLLGHAGYVNSVTFSPDGVKIVSGSDDQTVCVWDAESGSMILSPLLGHTHCVKAVAFSPDGTKIVSGSHDKTVRIWDVESGSMILGPLPGCSDLVNSVAFSPDGTKIVSGSRDRTVRVWDAESGSIILGPLHGHTDWVKSVAFSPDGTKVVSCSDDRTVRVWDAESGTTILGPSLGHTDLVNSVAFSPDGTKIVSGSDDRTVCLWDAESGSMVLTPLLGHTNTVNSVAFSPDGTKIVSGSRDKTVRVWDVESGTTILGPLLGHTDRVASVAFSRDGTKIVSGSHDLPVRVWDAHSGLPDDALSTSNIPFRSWIPDSFFDHTVLSDVGWINPPGSKRLLWIPSPLRHHFSPVASVTGERGVQVVWFDERFLPIIVNGLDFAWWEQGC